MNDKLTELRELMNEILNIFDNLDLRYLKTKIYYLEQKNNELQLQIQKEKRDIILNKLNVFLYSYHQELDEINDLELAQIVIPDLKAKLSLALNEIEYFILKATKKSNIKIEYTKNYLNKLKKKTYLDNLKLIKNIETKIINYLQTTTERPYKNNLAKYIIMGKYKGYFHAWIPRPIDNHRIVYKFEDKKIIFWDIGTHNELGLD
ncbi:hypothetical protein J4223_00855 [Candidatus Woesearchaeota archaeon]|nr:hypothetical protein [Candidatus Woesearchaeota archaeon]